MHIKKLPSGSWFVQVRHGRHRRSGTAPSKRDAKQLGADLMVEMRGLGELGDRPTVRGIIDRCVSEADWAPRTRENYLLAVKRVPDRLAAKRADTVTVGDVEDAYAALEDVGLGAHAIRSVHSLLSLSFVEGLRMGALPSSPMPAVKPPKISKARIVPPAPDVVASIIRRCESDSERVALRIAATTGARRGEVVAIRWSSVNLDAPGDHLRIVESLSLSSIEGMHERPTKTGVSGQRSVALDPGTIRDLRALRAAQLQLALEHRLPRPEFVFSNDAGVTPWRPDYLTHLFVRARTAAGRTTADGPRLHDLRHFAATQQLSKGVPVRIVSKRLGHSDTRTTERVYDGWIPGEDLDVADLMGNLLDGTG